FGGNPALSFTVNSATQITAVVPVGTGAVPVTVTTPGGTSNSVTYAYVVAPVLTAVSPVQGRASGGTTVILTGTGLTGATAVSFGSNPATSFTVNSATQITAVAPAGTGPVSVSVTTPGGTSNSVVYTYVAAPVLTAIFPVQGRASGGTTVILTGAGLTGATAVSFGSSAATSYTVNSATQITAVAPAGTGPVSVSVTTPGGTSNSVVYTYVATPALTALSPNQGPTDAGASVTLTGTALTTTNTVSFGATPAAFTVLSDTTVVAQAPAGPAGPVPVTVTTVGGTSNSVVYAYVAAPVLTGVSPVQGRASGGTTVILTGVGLTGATAVNFGGNPALSFTVNSATQITAVAPVGTGAVPVTVTTVGGTTGPVYFFYVVAPSLTAVSPNQGRAS
ncbi:IPT/TIG domain-containing protein, partial [Streptomyces yanii]